jgi:hypothetical protein
MRVGLFRRTGAFLFDAMPIAVIVSLLFTLWIGDIIKPSGYDEMYAEYLDIRDDYFGDLDQMYLDEELSLEDYQEQYDALLPQFQAETEDHYAQIVIYMIRVVVYHLIGFTLLYFIYIVATKGRTLGRRMLHIEYGGKVTFWRLLVREVIWKFGYWTITLVIGGILLDAAMIGLSQKKQALRDIVSGIYLKYEGVEYPF